MKSKLLMTVAGMLLASSSLFASWGISIGVGPRPYYRPYRYYAPRPYAYVAPVPPPPPVYLAPAPRFWVPGHWEFGRYGRYWIPGHWVRR